VILTASRPSRRVVVSMMPPPRAASWSVGQGPLSSEPAVLGRVSPLAPEGPRPSMGQWARQPSSFSAGLLPLPERRASTRGYQPPINSTIPQLNRCADTIRPASVTVADWMV